MSAKGIDCKLMINTSGNYESPTWAEAKCINDFKQSLGWNKAVAGSRASRVNKSVKTTLDLSWSGSFNNDGSAPANAMRDAILSDDVLDLLILDGAMDDDDTTGFRVDCQVFKADTDQGREALLYPEIEIMPTESDHEPQAVTVVGGVLTYAEIT